MPAKSARHSSPLGCLPARRLAQAFGGTDRLVCLVVARLRKRLTTEGDDPFNNDDLDTVYDALGVDDEGNVATNVLIEALCSGGGGGDA